MTNRLVPMHRWFDPRSISRALLGREQASRRRPSVVAALPLTLALAVAASACKSTDPQLLTEVGEPIAALDPAPYRVAIAPIAVAPESNAVAPDAKWGLSSSDPEQLRELFLRAAGELDLASDVLVLPDPTDQGWLQQHQVDLVIQPRITECKFDYGGNERLGASLGLWITTWICSLWVEDSRYATGLVMECAFADPNAQGGAVPSIALKSEDTALTFWERNKAFSLGFFTTMILPPFLTSDNRELSSQSLTEHSFQHNAAELKKALLDHYTDSPDAIRVEIRSPRNGTAVEGDQVELDYTLYGTSPFGITYYLNGVAVPPAQQHEEPAPPDEVDTSRPAGVDAVHCTATLNGLLSGKQDLLRLLVTDYDGRRTSRTLVLR